MPLPKKKKGRGDDPRPVFVSGPDDRGSGSLAVIGRFAMGGDVETFLLALLRDAQEAESPQDTEDDEAADARAEERRRREIEPTLSMLRSALLETPTTEEDRIAQQRMKGMHDLIELMSTWFDDVQRMDHKTLAQLMKMGSKVQRLLEFTGKMKLVPGGKASV